MQIEQPTLVTCEACSTRVPIKEMKFDLRGTELICAACSEQQTSRSTSAFEKKNFGQSLAIERRIERAQRAEDYVFYKCEGCTFSFSRKASFTFKKCPNCGSESVKTMQTNTAQKVVDGADEDFDLGIDFV